MNKETDNTGLKIYGVAASPGISIGIAKLMQKNKVASTGILVRNDHDVKTEIEILEFAIQTSVSEVENIIKKEEINRSQDGIEILETHIEFLTDPQLKADVCREISDNRKNAFDAVTEVIDKTIHAFMGMGNEYLRARAADVQDIGDRILKNLNAGENKEQTFQPNSIIIAKDISPTEVFQMAMNGVIGFVTRVGGSTSHAAILAKSKNIPAVLGCGDAINNIVENDVIIVDAENGLVIVNPKEDLIREYNIKKTTFDQQHTILSTLKETSAQTKDGIKIELLSNISSPEELEESMSFGAEGVGLFRTEWIYLNRSSFPTEDEQFEIYKQVALKAKGKSITIRTIDIGGDKPLSYLNLPKEENPFLGYRGIRFCLDRKDIFIVQLKAILRASMFGNIKIMFPMISTILELRKTKEMLNTVIRELKGNNIQFDNAIRIGIMIEVPSAAITADILAKEVDFFSIGSNDLCQYTLAVDRGNKNVHQLYDPYDPALIRLIHYVIEQADKNKIDVSICGELASDPRATLLLMGMGLKTFSMSASSIPVIKGVILNNDYTHAKEICRKVLEMDNSKSIITYLQPPQ